MYLQRRVWDCLNTTSIFQQEEKDGKSTWTYDAPKPPPAPPLMTSLSELQASLPPSQPKQPRFQHTMQALSDLTGYIAAQTYAIPSTLRFGSTSSLMSPEAEDARREIRALKGLVLNRYVRRGLQLTQYKGTHGLLFQTIIYAFTAFFS